MERVESLSYNLSVKKTVKAGPGGSRPAWATQRDLVSLKIELKNKKTQKNPQTNKQTGVGRGRDWA